MKNQRQRWAVFLIGTIILVIVLVLTWMTMAVVGQNQPGGTVTLPARLDLVPEEVMEQLVPAPNFNTISQDFAETLDVPVDSLQVRLRPKGCSACEMKESAALGSQSLVDAQELVSDSDAAWLTQGDMTCFYLLQKEQWIPKSCSILQ